jgi:hypothetical protein
MLVTFEGSIATNQYLDPPVSHIELSHPSLPDTLLLAEYDDKPYERYFQGRTQSNDRSLLGAIKLKGGNWKKYLWECNFLATPLQVALFEDLLQAQQDDVLPCGSVDRWFDSTPGGKSVWIDVDRQYLTIAGGVNWFRLQFRLLEV